jgi:hypothetical protein
VEKVAALSAKSANGQWTETEILEWETIDDMDRGRRAAENKCAVRRSGQYSWSPELDRAGSCLSYWRLRLSWFTSKKTNLEALAHFAAAPASLNPAKTGGVRDLYAKLLDKLVETWTKFRSMPIFCVSSTLPKQPSSQPLSIAWMFKQLPQLSLHVNLHHTIPSAGSMKPGRSNGLNRLDVPNEYAVRREGEAASDSLSSQEEMEDALPSHGETFSTASRDSLAGEERLKLGLDCTSVMCKHC